MIHIDAMKQWLEALEVANSCFDDYYLPKEKAWLPEIEQAIASLRQAIAEAEKQEPVAWMNDSTPAGIFARHKKGAENFGCTIPLYTHPQPNREPLTDEQIYSMVADITDVRRPYLQFARAIEAAHGIKE